MRRETTFVSIRSPIQLSPRLSHAQHNTLLSSDDLSLYLSSGCDLKNNPNPNLNFNLNLNLNPDFRPQPKRQRHLRQYESTPTHIQIPATDLEERTPLHVSILHHLVPVRAREFHFLLGRGVDEGPHEVDECLDDPGHVLHDAQREVLGVVVAQDVQGFAGDLGGAGV